MFRKGPPHSGGLFCARVAPTAEDRGPAGLRALAGVHARRFAAGVRRSALIFLGLVAAVALTAQERAFNAEELARPPSASRLDALVESAGRQGWGEWVEPLRQAAFQVYARDAAAAGPWYHLYRWARLFATPRRQAVESWLRAVDAARVGHPNMAARYELPPGSLAAEVPPALQRWLIGQPDFSRDFFATLDDVDHPIEVLSILRRIHAASPALFADYASLALAIAVVYDVPPPPDWPHGQVAARLLPRRLPDPVEAFNHWARLDRTGASVHRLRRLPAFELKFIVDASAPLAELAWAQRQVTWPLAQFSRAYDQIRYRDDRLTKQQFTWPASDYRLATILREGGICVDQAYFAANAGKARGLPTLLFRGAGLDGRHAWFGYLGAGGWVLDAGRYAEQRYVAGLAHDPQTWRNFTDHELLFLSERFRATPLYQLAQLHADFALELLRGGDPRAAVRAAREAVRREPRNLTGWQALLTAQEAVRDPVGEREATLREARRAFQRYPDLEAAFARRLIQSLHARGEKAAAVAEEQQLLRKHQAGRVDLSMQQAGEILQRSLREDDLPTRIKTYRRLLETHGRGAGIDFFDQVVTPFVLHLRAQAQLPAARDALQRARQTLRVEPGGQLEGEFERAAAELRKAR